MVKLNLCITCYVLSHKALSDNAPANATLSHNVMPTTTVKILNLWESQNTRHQSMANVTVSLLSARQLYSTALKHRHKDTVEAVIVAIRTGSLMSPEWFSVRLLMMEQLQSVWTEQQRSGPFITWTLSAGKRIALGRKTVLKSSWQFL